MLDLTHSSFSGHETFAFRFGWLPKGVRAIEQNPAVFAADSAMVDLGVGKNMVKSIRHWGLAAQLLMSADDTGRDAKLKPTHLGRLLFSKKEGQDRHLEDPGTLWLLHWLICTNDTKATTWRWAFGYWSQTEFTREGMVEELLALVSRMANSRANRQSIERDVDTFLHTYVAPRTSRDGISEESLDSPLVDLRLLRVDDISGRYEFVRGARASLPNTVLGFAIHEYWDKVAPSQESLSFETLLYGEGSPGRVFRITESAMSERIDRIAGWSRGTLSYDSTAGMRQLYRRKAADKYSLLFPRVTTRQGA